MPVKADGVGVDRAVDALGLDGATGSRENLVTAPAHGELRRQRVLNLVRCRQSVSKPLRCFRFAGPQHVRMVLCICVQAQVGDAEVHVEEIAGHDDFARIDPHAGYVEGVLRLTLHVNAGMEPGVEAEVHYALTQKPAQIAGRGDSGSDRRLGEHLGDDGMGDAHDVRVHRHL